MDAAQGRSLGQRDREREMTGGREFRFRMQVVAVPRPAEHVVPDTPAAPETVSQNMMRVYLVPSKDAPTCAPA